MRTFIVSIGVLAIVAFAGPARVRADAALTGQMASSNYLVGNWNCTTKLPAMMGQPARTEPATVTFEAAPSNVLRDHVTSTDYAGDDYFGYNDQTKTYWSASADNSGAHGGATSTDGRTYIGTSMLRSVTMNVTSTYTKVSADSITFHEVISGDGAQVMIDSACTR
ncbi:MAG: hypothetical protein JO092_02010 [Candidatus Eremiobacteraeota bacterium]|nr:hypothetical protein [Candidatus Eremiobacteraeota bacterium]